MSEDRVKSRAELVVFCRDYVKKRRQVASKRGEKWPGKNASPFMHELTRMVDAAFDKDGF